MKVSTVKDLEEAHTKNLKTDHARDVHRCHMRGFLKHTQKDWSTPLSDVFNGTFTQDLNEFVSSKKTKVTRDRAVRALRSWEMDAQQLIIGGSSPPDFGDALRQLIRESKMAVAEIAMAICKRTGEVHGSVVNGIHKWRKNRCLPSPQNISRVELIEDILKVKRGTLLSRIPDFVRDTRKLCKTKTRYSPYSKRVACNRDVYVMDVEKTPHLKAEWDDLYRFKTASILKPGEQRQRRARWTVRLSNNCPTGSMHKKHTGLFLGFLHLKKSNDKRWSGLDIPVSRLSIALLSLPSFVVRYINEFMVQRADGIYNHMVLSFLIFAREQVTEETGYLRQHPELFAHKVTFTEEWRLWIKTVPDEHRGLSIEARWDAWCEHAYRRYHAIIVDLRHNRSIKVSRDPEYNIRAILRLDHPMDALFMLIDQMEKRHKGDEKPASALRRGVKYRNLLLIKLLSVNPLRVRNLAEMTYRTDNTGHLQQYNGTWYIRIRKEEFKNWFSNQTDKDYVAPLPLDCNRYIEQYLAFRRYLKNADTCDNLFLREPHGVHAHAETRGMRSTSLSQLVVKLTRIYLPAELAPGGFGPHAFRHIIAHSYLKNNPRAYVVVADVLNDKLETIIKEYGHVGIADNFKHWLNFYAEEQERLKNAVVL